MTTYYFDVQDRGHKIKGTVGIDLGHDATAIREAMMIVWQLLSDASAQNRAANLTVSIRTEAGACIYEASTAQVNE